MALRTLFVSLVLAGSVTTALAAPRFAQPPPGYAPRVAQLDADDVVSRAQVRAKLAEARAASMAAFHTYRVGNSYPLNTDTQGALNVWRDFEGRYCAAATILRVTGGEDLASRVPGDLGNDIKLGDVTSGALMDWILTSGLTQGELALIQRPFMGVTKPMPPHAPVDDMPLVVDSAKRRAETKRLAKLYAQIEGTLKKQTAASLDKATDRLMANPALARQFLRS